MADALPKWGDVAASPEFQSADSSQREAMRMGYREKLAEASFLAGGDDAAVAAHLKKFDEFSKPGVLTRIKDAVTGRPTAASAAALGLNAASQTAGNARSVMAGMDGTPVDTRASRYAPLSAQGLSALERKASGNPERTIAESTGSGVVARAQRGVAQDLVNQRTVTAHAGLNRTVETALGMDAKTIPAIEEDPIERAKAGPRTVYDTYEDGAPAEVGAGDVAKTIARSVPEGVGSLVRGTYSIDRLADPLAGKLAQLFSADPSTEAQVRAYRELERDGKLRPWQEFGAKVLDWMLPVSAEGKKAIEQPLFLGNPLKGDAPVLNPRATLSQFIAKGGQVFGQMAPIIAAGVIAGPAGGAVAGAAQAADEGGDEEGSRIKKMSPLELNKIPVYRQYLEQGASPEEARLATAADAARWASVVQGMIGSLDGLLFKGAGEAAKKSLFKGFVKGAAEQGAQEPAESIGARAAASVAVGEKLDLDRIGAGLYDDAALGALSGGPIKAATEAGGKKASPDAPAAAPRAEPRAVPEDAVPAESVLGTPSNFNDSSDARQSESGAQPDSAESRQKAESPPEPQSDAVSPEKPSYAAPRTVDDGAHAAATSPQNDLPEPTEAEKEAGNYAKGRARIAGLDLAIENPEGSIRSGTAADGTKWETTMADHYGYIRGTIGKDKDHVDAFVKPGTPEDYRGPVFVVDQVDPKTGALDEHKVIIGAATEEEARAIYRRNYAKDWNGLGDISRLPMAAFKSWVKDGAKREPLGDITQWKSASDPAQADLQNSTDGARGAQGEGTDGDGVAPTRSAAVRDERASGDRAVASNGADGTRHSAARAGADAPRPGEVPRGTASNGSAGVAHAAEPARDGSGVAPDGQPRPTEAESTYGQQSLFASDVPASDRADLVGRIGSSGPEGVDARAAVDRAAQRDLPGRYSTGVTLRPAVTRDIAVSRVRTLKDAAAAMGSLAELVREHVDVLVTGDDGRILAVQRMFAGASSQASVFPAEILKFVTAIKGAREFFIAHNHPNGNHELSDADTKMSRSIAASAEGVGPAYRGIVAVTHRGYAGYSERRVHESAPLTLPSESHRVTYLEEVIEKTDYLGPKMTSPQSALKGVADIAQGEQGIVFVDGQLHPTGFLPISMEDARALRGKELGRDVIAAAYRSRAHFAIITTQRENALANDGGQIDGAKNIGTMLARVNVKVVDVLDAQGRSRASIGDSTAGKTLYKRGSSTPPEITARLKRLSGLQQLRTCLG